ncbi:hypothetical protein F2P45_30315 [Massilia sp. CCM 8733]|uniref:Secreted protein n=1 Tax=Massilia mucilaginosa TaxID=2609282 RepID=A0ABX0P1U8_9BURK|nr:hypothetical protein [Massilia mucilaginosa]NHZ93273.1 hypothetical protein [Massilia mucilaginosa]
MTPRTTRALLAALGLGAALASLSGAAHGAADRSVEYQKKLLIGLVDEERGKVVSSLSTVFDEDALTEIGYKSLRLDTARYKLAPGVRAFGFDLIGRNRHYCPDGGLGPTRYLYVREGKKIRQIMAEFAVSRWAYIGEDESSCGKIEAPARPVENEERSLSVAASRTNGYADLLVTSTTSVDGKKGVVRTTRIVRYDGDSYPVNQGSDF